MSGFAISLSRLVGPNRHQVPAGAEALGRDPLLHQPADAFALVEDADEERNLGALLAVPVALQVAGAGRGQPAGRTRYRRRWECARRVRSASPFVGEFDLQVGADGDVGVDEQGRQEAPVGQGAMVECDRLDRSFCDMLALTSVGLLDLRLKRIDRRQ